MTSRTPAALDRDAHEVHAMVARQLRAADGLANPWDAEHAGPGGRVVIAGTGTVLLDPRRGGGRPSDAAVVGAVDPHGLLRGEVRRDLERRTTALLDAHDPVALHREVVVHRTVGLAQEAARDLLAAFPLLAPALDAQVAGSPADEPLLALAHALDPGSLALPWAGALPAAGGLPSAAAAALAAAPVHTAGPAGRNTPWQLDALHRNLRTVIDRVLGDPHGPIFDVYDREAVAAMLLDATRPLTSAVARLGVYPLLAVQAWLDGRAAHPSPTVPAEPWLVGVPRWWWPRGSAGRGR